MAGKSARAPVMLAAYAITVSMIKKLAGGGGVG